MPVFFITVRVDGLRFREMVYGNREEYTENEIKKIVEESRKKIRMQLRALGYIG